MKKTKVITEEEFNAMYHNLLVEKNPFIFSEANGFLKALETIYGDDTPEWVMRCRLKITCLMLKIVL